MNIHTTIQTQKQYKLNRGILHLLEQILIRIIPKMQSQIEKKRISFVIV